MRINARKGWAGQVGEAPDALAKNTPAGPRWSAEHIAEFLYWFWEPARATGSHLRSTRRMTGIRVQPVQRCCGLLWNLPADEQELHGRTWRRLVDRAPTMLLANFKQEGQRPAPALPFGPPTKVMIRLMPGMNRLELRGGGSAMQRNTRSRGSRPPRRSRSNAGLQPQSRGTGSLFTDANKRKRPASGSGKRPAGPATSLH